MDSGRSAEKLYRKVIVEEEVLISLLCFSPPPSLLCAHIEALNLVIPGFICEAMQNGFPFK